MITKSPQDKNIYFKNTYFTKSARTAFSYILKLIRFNKNDSILIPAYIGYTDREGSGVLDPIIDNEINYLFYPIKKDFSLDLSLIENKITNTKVKAILLIHYFGFYHCDIISLKKICERNKVLLIEDCAHTLYSKYKNEYLGAFGDFSFYSLHKVLPVEEGGYFKINNKKYTNIEVTLKEEDKASIETLETLLNYDETLAQKQVLLNYKYMAKQLEDIKGIELIAPKISDDIFPLNLPVLITGMKRETFYFKMIEEGIVLIALYYRLINSLEKKIYPDSSYISESIINFPINQDITLDDMDEIIGTTKKILEEIK